MRIVVALGGNVLPRRNDPLTTDVPDAGTQGMIGCLIQQELRALVLAVVLDLWWKRVRGRAGPGSSQVTVGVGA
jgi:carbamate kinase